MVLKLDGRYAIVWRDPFSLQLGVDPSQVVLREVTEAVERMIAALVGGVSRSGLDMIAASAGATEREVDGLLRTLRPVLLDAPADAPPHRVAIVGAGQTVDRIATTLALAGVSVSIGAAAGEDPVDLGIAVGHYVLDPDSYGFWLRRDLPHLPVVFGDEVVSIGPLVEPGITPCLYCLEYYRRDADSSWAAIASQLWGRRSPVETSLVSIETSARVARFVLTRLDSGRTSSRALASRSFRLAANTGEVTRRDWLPHPDCGCHAIPTSGLADLSEGRRESDSARDSDQPTTGAVSVERA